MSNVGMVFDVEKPKKKKRMKTDQSLTEDEIKSEALLEIARSPVIKKYFNLLIGGYNRHIIENSRPDKLDEKRTALLELHAKKESLEKLLQASEDERKLHA